MKYFKNNSETKHLTEKYSKIISKQNKASKYFKSDYRTKKVVQVFFKIISKQNKVIAMFQNNFLNIEKLLYKIREYFQNKTNDWKYPRVISKQNNSLKNIPEYL